MASFVSVKSDQQHPWISSMTKEFGIKAGSSSEGPPQSLTSRISETATTSTGDTSCDTVSQSVDRKEQAMSRRFGP